MGGIERWMIRCGEERKNSPCRARFIACLVGGFVEALLFLTEICYWEVMDSSKGISSS